MTTPSCGGARTDYNFLDFIGSFGQITMPNWRCVIYSQLHSPKVEQSRSARQEKALTLSSAEPDYLDEEVHLGVESFLRKAA
jgi:hypothetical protein